MSDWLRKLFTASDWVIVAAIVVAGHIEIDAGRCAADSVIIPAHTAE